MPFQLNVLNLQYDPPTNVVKVLEAIEATKSTVVAQLPSVIGNLSNKIWSSVPQVVSDTSLHAQLIHVSFRARAGEVTAVLSTSLPERKSISDLVINRCRVGMFDGDIVMEGVAPDTSYDNNCAFVHRVRYSD